MNHETQHTASFTTSSRKPLKPAATVALGAWLFGGVAQAATEVEMHRVSSDGVGESVGSVMAEDTDDGLLARSRCRCWHRASRKATSAAMR